MRGGWLRFNPVGATVATSRRAHTGVSEYGHAVFGTVIVTGVAAMLSAGSSAKADDPVFQRI
jgi:hypothetical protein